MDLLDLVVRANREAEGAATPPPQGANEFLPVLPAADLLPPPPSALDPGGPPLGAPSENVGLYLLFEQILEQSQAAYNLTVEDYMEHMVGVLSRFLARYGRYPQYHERFEKHPLGRWCDLQKKRLWNSQLRRFSYQLQALPGWNSSPPTQREWWDTCCSLAEDFTEEWNGLPPVDYVNAEGVNLGEWCARQRRKFNNGNLPRERSAALQKLLGWGSSPVPVSRARWLDFLRRAVDFLKYHKRKPLPFEKHHGRAVGIWWAIQPSPLCGDFPDLLELFHQLESASRVAAQLPPAAGPAF